MAGVAEPLDSASAPADFPGTLRSGIGTCCGQCHGWNRRLASRQLAGDVCSQMTHNEENML
jgi:hypothetical protein